jgi:hypothetical protein
MPVFAEETRRTASVVVGQPQVQSIRVAVDQSAPFFGDHVGAEAASHPGGAGRKESAVELDEMDLVGAQAADRIEFERALDGRGWVPVAGIRR